jgi:chromosome partitioning protein
MAILGVSNQKGGTGKTTCSVHLAEGIAMKGVSVCLYDWDPQGSASWHMSSDSRKWLSAVRVRREKDIRAEILALSREFDVVVVDTKPDLGQDTLDVLSVSDLVIFPIKPGGYEIHSMNRYIDFVEPIRKQNPSLVFRSLVVFASKTRVLGRQVNKVLEQCPFPPFENQIPLCEDFNNLPVERNTIWDVNKGGNVRKVKRAFNKLCDEVVEQLVEIQTGK